MIDYCVAHMTWNLGFTHDRCVDDFTGQLAGATELRAVLHEVEERQVKEVRDPEVLRFLVGSDDEIETAESMGLHFHPLPPAPAEVVGWSDAQIQTLRERSLAPLARIAVAYNAFADRVEAQLRAQSPEQAPWVREIRDGLRAYGLRAEHAVASARRNAIARARGGRTPRQGAQPGARPDRGGARRGAPPRERIPISRGAGDRGRRARLGRRAG
jgi:hypothetical protein